SRGNVSLSLGGKLVPQVDPSPNCRQTSGFARCCLFRFPGAGDTRPNATGERVQVVVADISRAVVEVVEVDVLPDDLRLRLQLPTVAEIKGVTSLKRRGETEAIDILIWEADLGCPV